MPDGVGIPLFTDAVIERFDDDGTRLGEERFLDTAVLHLPWVRP